MPPRAGDGIAILLKAHSSDPLALRSRESPTIYYQGNGQRL